MQGIKGEEAKYILNNIGLESIALMTHRIYQVTYVNCVEAK